MAGKSKKGAAQKPRKDDLPAIASSRLRALGVIADGMETVEIAVGGLTRTVGLWHMRFPDTRAGKPRSWSYFLCPNCGRKCRALRLYDGRLVCASCDGLYWRCQLAVDRQDKGARQDKGPRLARLRALLAEARPDRRGRLERALRRALIVARRERVDRWKKARKEARRAITRGLPPHSSDRKAT